jgi:hypothetical protein
MALIEPLFDLAARVERGETIEAAEIDAVFARLVEPLNKDALARMTDR